MTGFSARSSIVVVGEAPHPSEAIAAALIEAPWRGPLYQFGDSESALDCVHQRGRFAAQRGDVSVGLVVVSLGANAEPGVRLTQSVRGSAGTRHIPIVAVVGASEPSTIQLCYSAGVNACVEWPHLPDEQYGLARNVVKWWLHGVPVVPDDNHTSGRLNAIKA